MSIGSDIKKAFEAVGSTYLIKRKNSPFLSGEYCVYEISTALRVPFDREFVYQASLSYDTLAVEGDILLFSDGEQFLLANKDPEQFANSPVVFESKLLKINVISGEIYRSSGETWDSQYHKIPIWSLTESGVGGLLIETTEVKLEEKEDFGKPSTNISQLYIPNTMDIKVLDRFQPTSGEYYQVNALRKRVFPGLIIVEVSEDMRE